VVHTNLGLPTMSIFLPLGRRTSFRQHASNLENDADVSLPNPPSSHAPIPSSTEPSPPPTSLPSLLLDPSPLSLTSYITIPSTTNFLLDNIASVEAALATDCAVTTTLTSTLINERESSNKQMDNLERLLLPPNLAPSNG